MDYDKILSHFENLSILYVEDNPNCVKETSQWLNDFFGYVSVCEDGEDGLRDYKNFYKQNGKYYDVVLSDINMPILNGLDMSRKILKINQNQIIVILTAYNDPDYTQEAQNLGIKHLLLKPTNMKDVLNTLYSATE